MAILSEKIRSSPGPDALRRAAAVTALLSILFSGGFSGSAAADEAASNKVRPAEEINTKDKGGEPPASGPKLGGRGYIWTDLISRNNPLALEWFVGFAYRNVYAIDRDLNIEWSYWQTGVYLGLNPAYLQTAVDFMWTPWAFLQLRVEYSLFFWYGAWWSLLSFNSPTDGFDMAALNEMSGQEQKGEGQRILFQPIFTLQYKFVVLRNQTDFAGCFYNGEGPYFYDQEYNILVKKGADLVIRDMADLLFQVWHGKGDATVMLGPHYDITWGLETSILRQRAGLSFFTSPADRFWKFDHPRLYFMAGAYIEDPNPGYDDHFVIEGGIGSDFDLF